MSYALTPSHWPSDINTTWLLHHFASPVSDANGNSEKCESAQPGHAARVVTR